MGIKRNIKHFLLYSNLLAKFTTFYYRYVEVRKRKFGFFSKTARVRYPIRIKGIENVYMYEDTHLLSGAFIIAKGAKFVMKKHSGAAEGLTVVTNTHPTFIGEWFMEKGSNNDFIEAKDIIVEEDVWIATNVTLLMGAHIGRGAVLGAGSVIRTKVPPYAMVMGNPAKIVGFKFNPEQAIEHEKALYPPEERLSLETLEKNYKKYFLDRVSEIKSFTKI